MVRSKKGSLIEHLISPDILLEHSVTDLHSKIDIAKPYGHLQIHNLFDKKLLILAQEEAKVNLTADFKESDLFKLFQTIDLGNFDSKDKKVKSKLPHLYQLKEYIYSVEFRNFISQITDVKDLIDRVDCSINIYTNGCHLLCHDDVIGTRRVSFIIYLTDPYEEWNYEDGGGLELYPLDPSSITEGAECKYNSKHTQGVPTPNPTKILLPSFNSMVLFPVQPGRSYHSVQEIYSDKPRMSIRLLVFSFEYISSNECTFYTVDGIMEQLLLLDRIMHL
jgi:Rps23 Pro-64 3,4-dihydroxylase Tpa1-like proline 4-hydroxylase